MCTSYIHSEFQDRGNRAFKQVQAFLKLHRIHIAEANLVYVCHGLRAQSRRVGNLMACGSLRKQL